MIIDFSFVIILAKDKLKETVPTRAAGITLHVSIPKGIVFAVENEEIFPLANKHATIMIMCNKRVVARNAFQLRFSKLHIYSC